MYGTRDKHNRRDRERARERDGWHENTNTIEREGDGTRK